MDDMMDFILKEIDTDELIQAFKEAVEELPGSGARGRSHYYKIEAEIKRRLDEK